MFLGQLLGWPNFQTCGVIARWAREEQDGSLAAKRVVVLQAVTSLQGILLFNGENKKSLLIHKANMLFYSGHEENDLTVQVCSKIISLNYLR